MRSESPTFIGKIDSVKGAVLTIRLRSEVPVFLNVEGFSYRVGQIGAFLRIPLGYNQLYAVCTLVGAAAAPSKEQTTVSSSHRWLSATLFGESIGGVFERGVSQYPTIDDEVHLVTPSDVAVIYGSAESRASLRIGHIASSPSISGEINLGRFVARHSAIVGATGSGKSNLVAVLLEAIATQDLPAARVLVIDPHGEYGPVGHKYGSVFKVKPDRSRDEKDLYVPYWALPFDEFREITMGSMQPPAEVAVREVVASMKKDAAALLSAPPPESVITADSPIPFSAKKLWYDLDVYERQTFEDRNRSRPCTPTREGSATDLVSNLYPAPSPGGAAPYANQRRRNIARQLETMKSRLSDSRFSFLFSPGDDLTPDIDGQVTGDLDTLVASWIGHDEPVTVLDVSGLPAGILPTVVGTLLRVVYDLLFWAGDLPISGRNQPLLVVLEEAHLFLPEGGDTTAHRTVSRIAKEGRKYGVGLSVVTQRPGEIDSAVLSQCGTLAALRLTNTRDRSKVAAALPDDLGGLSGMLPALRTGEGIVVGEALAIPSRILFYQAVVRLGGGDPDMPGAWMQQRPADSHYAKALQNWRVQSYTTGEDNDDA